MTESSRRTFLKAAAASGTMAAVGGVAAQDTETIELDALIGGWEGVAPSGIEGETNPTLDLEVGRSYRVVWTNVDGFDHNFVVLNADGDQVVRSEVIGEQGATQTVEFEATEEMAEYFCEVHPGSMRGDVAIAEPQSRRNVPVGDSVGLQRVAEGLNAPLAMETAPDGRRFVVDQTGQVYELTEDGLADEPFLDVSDRLVDLGIVELRGYDERGLLGLAFHPEFEENGRFFVRYSAPLRDEVIPEGAAPVETARISGAGAAAGNATDGNATAAEDATKAGDTDAEYDHTDVLAEFRATDDPSSADPDSERALWQLPSPQTNHNGGALAFGSDGYLYTSLGDGGAADDVGFGHVDDWYDDNEGGNGQNTTESLFGGIHRIDVDEESADRPYAVPVDNPLAGTDEGFPEYYAWGFRNPWRMSFDSDGRLFVGDAGQNRYEEVDLVEHGGNYGWNVREGTHCFDAEDPSAPPEQVGDCPGSTPDDVRGGEPLRDPVIEYTHRHFTTAFIDGSVVIGGYVYEGDAIDALQGAYVFGNWSGEGVVDPDGQIFVADETQADDGGTWPLEELVVEGSEGGSLNRYVYGFGQDADGELYVLTSTTFRPEGETGEVFKLVPPDEGETLPDPVPDDEQGDGNQTATNETATTVSLANETDANETGGNQSIGG